MAATLTATEISDLIDRYQGAATRLVKMTSEFKPLVHARCLADQAEVIAALTAAGRADLSHALWTMSTHRLGWKTQLQDDGPFRDAQEVVWTAQGKSF